MNRLQSANSRSQGENAEGLDPSPELNFAAPVRLLTRDELAAALRVSSRTVQEMVSAEEIPVVRIRCAVRFYLPDVVRCLTANALISKRGCAHRLGDDKSALEAAL